MVLHHGYIHLYPMKSRTAPAYVSAFKSVVSFFRSLSHPLTHILLDNETSSDLTSFFVSVNLSYQYVPPFNHRSNPAERAIRTARNHVISIFSSAHITFPPNRWHDLIPQAELTLNCMREWSLNPSLSAHHGLYRVPFDFASHPIHPPGQLVVAFDSPLSRASWARHGTRGFYLSPSPDHYRCFNVFFPSTGLSRVCETLSHFPDPLFPFEDPTLLPSVPDPTASRPSPTFDGADLVGRRFLDPDLGPCLVTGPGPQTFLQPHTGNLDAGTPLNPGWHPTLTYSYLVSNRPTTSHSSVSEVSRWVSLYPCPDPSPSPLSLSPSPARHPIPARTAGAPLLPFPPLPPPVVPPLLSAGTAGVPLPAGPAGAPLRRSPRLSPAAALATTPPPQSLAHRGRDPHPTPNPTPWVSIPGAPSQLPLTHGGGGRRGTPAVRAGIG